MTALAVRGIAERKLRSALTAVAVLLGVAMITGTYIETDQIRNAFEDISEQSVEGIDVIVTPDETFTSSFTSEPTTVDARLAGRVRGVDGVAAAEGQVTAFGRLVVDGKTVETMGAPGLVLGASSERFDPSEIAAGRKPAADNEAALLSQNAEDNGIELGDRIGVTTRRGVARVTVVGLFTFGEAGSLGGTTAVEMPAAQVQRLFDLRGRFSSISVIGELGVDPGELSRRIEAVLPGSARVQTGEENAQESADEINDQIGSFLTPALLALAGAAVLVGAFIIFNTFSITVTQRMREFAMLRALGATRRQVLGVVTGEALLVGIIASAAGIGAGVGFAKLLNALFDAVGFGIPQTGLVVAPRTIVIALVVGVGVTLAAAMVPALRATRVPPVAAMSGVPPRASARSRRLAAILTAVLAAAGAALTVQGLFGSGPATSKLGALAGGAIFLFVGIALSARYVVRPLAAVIGYPIERAFGTPGRLARENAERNPGRTAITSAALMVGLALVVFVAVFAAALKSSIGRQVDELIRAEIFVTGEDFQAIPAGAVKAAANVPGVEAAVPTLFDQLEVNAEKSNVVTDLLVGVDPSRLPAVYTFEWVDGDDSLLGELGRGQTLIEEQFANAHDLGVGDTYRVESPSGGRAKLRALGIYRDPTILQGSIASPATLSSFSPARDPIFVLVAVSDSADAAQVEAEVTKALGRFPSVTVESRAEYQETIESRLDQIVYLLYALLAMSLVISLFGIANSLFLSIHERTGELGVLRAIGATRGQLRRVIRYESVITSVIGGLLGTVVGVGFAWLGIESLSEFGFGLSIPVGQLLAFLALSVVVGVVGAIAPARRASRVDVLDALHYE
ncbi:MAG: FtsX-like permease family protein [bacterium]